MAAPVSPSPRLPMLGEVLIEHGFITADELDAALERQRNEVPRRRLGELLLDMALICDTDLATALAAQTGCECVDAATLEVDPDIGCLVPRFLAERHQVVAVSSNDDDEIVLLMADPTNVNAFDDVRAVLSQPVKAICAPPSQVAALIERFYSEE